MSGFGPWGALGRIRQDWPGAQGRGLMTHRGLHSSTISIAGAGSQEPPGPHESLKNSWDFPVKPDVGPLESYTLFFQLFESWKSLLRLS